MIESSILRILNSKGQTIGTGFLVSKTLAVTCAHVAMIAGLDGENRIRVQFTGQKQPIVYAKVLDEFLDLDRDIAILRLEAVPEGVIPMRLGFAEHSRAGNIFRSFGYATAAGMQGIKANGTIDGYLRQHKLVQLQSSQANHGVSGAPVWDEQRDLVIGIITKGHEELGRNENTTFATPTELIFKACPELKISRSSSKFDRISNIDLGNVRRKIPGLKEPIKRLEIDLIEEQLKLGKSVILTGAPGTGKSGIGFTLAQNGREQNKIVLFTDSRRFNSCNSESDFSQCFHLDGTFSDEVAQIGKEDGCRIIFDQFDSVIGFKASDVLAEIAYEVAALSGVEVILISRKKEGHEQDGLNYLNGKGFIEKEIFPISENETAALLEAIGLPSTKKLIEHGSNLLNLELIGQIKQDNPNFDFANMLDEVDIWLKYIDVVKLRETRVINSVDADSLISAATMLSKIGLKNPDRDFILDELSIEQKRLVSWEIIFLVEAGEYQYRFRHEKLQDFLFAKYAVSRGWMPDDVLNEISTHRTMNVFLWMQKIYKPPKLIQFLEKMLNA